MATVHMILQGKGGVGKSVISALIAQYKLERGVTPICIDTDPVNATFQGYKALKVTRLNIMEDDDIDPRAFDALIEQIATAKSDVIVDNGASSFVPLAHYLISNNVPAVLQEMGHDLMLHTVVTGGQALLDTVNGFAQLCAQFPDPSRFVVWLNPYWGPVESEGRQFEDMKAYKELKPRIDALIYLPELKQATHGRDFSELLQSRETFNEALNRKGAPIMVKQRLKSIKDQVFKQIAAVGVLDERE